MDISDLSDFIKLAKEKEDAELIRSEWLSLLPSMFAGIVKYVSYEEYLDRRTGKNLDLRPAEEIIAEIMELHGMEGGI